MRAITLDLMRSISIPKCVACCFSSDTAVSSLAICTRLRQTPASAVIVAGMLLISCSVMLCTTARATETLPFSAEEKLIITSMAGDKLQPVRDASNRMSGNSDAIAIGKSLFFDKRLSGDNQFSCATCHSPEYSWTDAKSVNNLRGTPLKRNTPSLWNLAWSRWYFWDGRADTLWLQALGPIESPIEQDGNRVKVVRLMREDSDLRVAYERFFGTFPPTLELNTLPMNGKPVPDDPDHPEHLAWNTLSTEQQQAINQVFANTGKLIAAFEETIVSRNSPFDRFAAGLQENDEEKKQALSLAAQRGLKLFIGKARCHLCHSGPNFSDSEFHGVMASSDKNSGNDHGRYAVIPELLNNEFNSKGPYTDTPAGEAGKLDYLYRSAELRNKFKTPILRNIVRTAPYMHTGEIETLENVVDDCEQSNGKLEEDKHRETALMAEKLSEKEQADLVEFLSSLTDEDFLNDF